MKHLLTVIAFAYCISLNAQSESAPSVLSSGNQRSGTPTTQALWDVDFSYNLTDSTQSVGCAGVCFVNNEIWISKWSTDTIIRLNASGTLINKFQIPGLSGIRAFTTDGNYVYAANNSTTIYRIDPLNATLAPPHITSAASTPVRWATYDSTLNSMAGGFWVGNFNTDIFSIDMSGNVLSTIPQTTHGLSGMYGAAVDNYTSGGPYLWIFSQSQTNNTTIYGVSLISGTAVTSHDAFPDISSVHSITSSLAGGVFLTNQFFNGVVTLMGVAQGNPDNVLVGYEILAPVAPIITNDIELKATYPDNNNVMLPSTHSVPQTFSVGYVNNSIATVDSFDIHFSILDGTSTQIFTDTMRVYSLLAGATGTQTTSPFLFNGNDSYTLRAVSVNGPAQIDSVSANDSVQFVITVNDSAFAHESNHPDTFLTAGIPSSDWGYLVSGYKLEIPDVVGGIWIRCSNPVAGDSTAAVIFDTTAIGYAVVPMLQGPYVFLDSSNWQFLPFQTGVALNAEYYGFGLYDPANGIFSLSVEATPDYDLSAEEMYTSATGWNTTGANQSWFIRPMLQSAMLHVADGTGPAISVFPNPATTMLSIYVGNDQTKAFSIMDMNGKTVKSFTTVSQNTSIDISGLASGNYVLHITTEGKTWSQNIIKAE